MKPHANPNVQGGRAVQIASKMCKCGHPLEKHRNGDCLQVVHVSGRPEFCHCHDFKPVKRSK